MNLNSIRVQLLFIGLLLATPAFAQVDTANDKILVQAINDPIVESRVWNLFNGQCEGVYAEASPTGPAHTARSNFCTSIAANKVPLTLLVSSILNPTTEAEILAGCCLSPHSANYAAGGNLVDADVITAIGVVLTVSPSVSTVSTTGSGTAGGDQITVASATGILAGQTVYAGPVPSGTTVINLSGATVTLSANLSGTMATGTPVVFVSPLTGLPTRTW